MNELKSTITKNFIGKVISLHIKFHNGVVSLICKYINYFTYSCLHIKEFQYEVILSLRLIFFSQ